MTRTARARLIPTGAVAVAGVLLAGCGPTSSADQQPSASAPSTNQATVALAQVAAKTSSAGTARVQVRTETSAGDAGSGASFSSTGLLEGVIDFGSGNAQLTTKLPTGDELESRSVDGVQYTRLPNPGGAQQDKPWLKIDLPEGARTGLGGLTDPTGGLVLLRDAGGPLTEIDRERVRDTATVHYRTELDVTKLPAPSPPAGTPGKPRPDTSGLLRRLLGDKPLPVEVWVDEQQRIRRLTLVLPIGNLTNAQPGTSSGPAAGPTATGKPGGTTTSTTEFFDFGVAVDVQPPPADQVRAARTRPPLPSGGPARAPSASPAS